jgi:hypothetical protein
VAIHLQRRTRRQNQSIQFFATLEKNMTVDDDNRSAVIRRRQPNRLALLVVWMAVLISCSITPLVVPSASACSIAARNPNTKFVRFTGKAVKHDLTLDGVSPTYRWTFVISKWDPSSKVKRRKPGAQIRVSVIEAPPVGATTTSVPNGTYNSCADVQFGIETVYKQNRSYDVTAAEADSIPGMYYVTHFVGLVQPAR